MKRDPPHPLLKDPRAAHRRRAGQHAGGQVPGHPLLLPASFEVHEVRSALRLVGAGLRRGRLRAAPPAASPAAQTALERARAGPANVVLGRSSGPLSLLPVADGLLLSALTAAIA